MEHSFFPSISALSSEIENGLSPVSVVKDSLSRIAKKNEYLKAMIFVDQEDALARAETAEGEIRSGHKRGPLHGVPIALKDAIDVAGWPTTGGSKLFGENIAEKDANCVAMLRSAGAIIIGKTNMHELTAGGQDNPWYGKVINPLDGNHGTGGTSSGSAAAVAAGFCVAALGTDTGGSNRSVAAATGLAGFKPSRNLIDPAGVLPTAPSLDTIGPIATSVEDARLVTEAMIGGHLPGFEDARQQFSSPCGLVLAQCPDLFGAPLDAAVVESQSAWLDSQRNAGVNVVQLSFGDNKSLVKTGIAILSYEFAREYGPLIEKAPERVAKSVLDFLEIGRAVTRGQYLRACETRQICSDEFVRKLVDIDLVIVPTSPGLAPRLNDELTRVGDAMVPYGLAGGRFRRWANMFGMPALAIPLTRKEGLPASVQLAARPGEDGKLFAIAEMLERLHNQIH